MRVTDLLQLEPLDLALRWGGARLLGREVTGVTVTDQEDPAPFVQPGDVVLSGLVWWTARAGRAKADRFVSALRDARAVALLAGEATHGKVPDAIVDACRTYSVPIIAVPSRTNFRTITDAVYLRQWSSLAPTGGHTLPPGVRRELDRLIAEGAPLDAVLAAVCAPLDLACQVVTAAGRTVAGAALDRTKTAALVRRGGATIIPVDQGTTPYDAWYLHVPAAAKTPPSALRELAEAIGRHRRETRPAQRHRAATRLITELAGPARDLTTAMHKCGLPETGPYFVCSLTLDDPAAALAVLGELLPAPFAAATLPHGETVAVHCGHAPTEDDLAVVHGCAPETPLHVGVSEPVGIAELPGALAQARHAARAAAASGVHLACAEDLTTLSALVSGLPESVRATYRRHVLGPLLDHGDAVLIETLESFLAHDGSWARAAKSLYVHVNTVHYRIERVEHLTGRDLSRLDHRLDLSTALLCR